jgi:hypothetical protein
MRGSNLGSLFVIVLVLLLDLPSFEHEHEHDYEGNKAKRTCDPPSSIYHPLSSLLHTRSGGEMADTYV